MAMRLTNENQLLDQGVRKKIIEEICGPENQARKQTMFNRHDMYRDNTKAYVAEVIEKEQGTNALSDIQFRISNLSILKTIVNKKAMIYGTRAERKVVGGDEKMQAQIDQVIDLLNFNSQMKKANKWEELFKNAIVQVYPFKNYVTGKWRIKLDVNLPYKIDAIEDENNNEQARVYIYSYFSPLTNSTSYTQPGQSGIHTGNSLGQNAQFRQGDGINQAIADSPIDSQKKEYVWWSTKYHFTTDEKGAIINGTEAVDSGLNPVQDLPFINISTSQDGNFWAVGGDDIVDGSVLVNLFLTEIYYIAKYQGMGLFYFFGRGVPKRIKVGPSQAITLDVKQDDPTPQIGFATSNPNISEYMMSIKEYISALLKTNKLEPSTVIGMENALQASSGIQELIQKSELNEAIEDNREVYRDAEPVIFKKYIKWHNYLYDRKLLDDDFEEIGRIDEKTKVTTKFCDPQVVMSESEKLDVIKKRQDLGLDSLVDSLMKDNPELVLEDAQEKAVELLKRKALDARTKMLSMVPGDKIGGQPPKAAPKKEVDDEEMSDEDKIIDEA